MELHWGDGCQIYITPVSPEEVCVVLISRNQYLRLDAALPQFPQLAAAAAARRTPRSERGGITASRRLKAVCRGNVALVGDASGSVDAITGEGLCLLFQHAVALADAFAANDLSLYEAAHRRAGRRPQFMSALMLMIDCRTRLRQPGNGNPGRPSPPVRRHGPISRGTTGMRRFACTGNSVRRGTGAIDIRSRSIPRKATRSS